MKLSKSYEITVVRDDDVSKENQPESMEKGVEIPFERIDPVTLNNLISEFVSRDWDEVGDTACSLDEKINQVLEQLKMKKAKVVFDLSSETCNIVGCRK
jgi:uncharacterized protein YheU (UPF0270 family)